MAGILLTHCNHIFFDPKQVRKMQPYPPLQTLIAAACLRAGGLEVALFDATFEAPEEGFRRALERQRPELVVICEDNFNFLTKMCLTRNRELAYFMCGAAHESGVPVVVNSSDASDHVFEYLGHGADFVLLGEVELTLMELSRAVARLCMDPAENSRSHPERWYEALSPAENSRSHPERWYEALSPAENSRSHPERWYEALSPAESSRSHPERWYEALSPAENSRSHPERWYCWEQSVPPQRLCGALFAEALSPARIPGVAYRDGDRK